MTISFGGLAQSGRMFSARYSYDLYHPHWNIARRHGIEMHLNADDTQLYLFFRIKDPSSQWDVLPLSPLSPDTRAWMVINKIELNNNKTEFLTTCAPCLRNAVIVDNLTVGTSHVAAAPS